MNKNPNLKPFQKGYDPRRQVGRKKGSKNLATIINDILQRDLDQMPNEKIKQLVNQQSAKTIKEAIILKMITRSLAGDLKAANWLFSFIDRQEISDSEEGFFDQKELTIKIIEPPLRQSDDSMTSEATKSSC